MIPGVVVERRAARARRAARVQARTRAARSSSTSPPSMSRSRAGSATTASTSAATCPRRRSARSSTAPTRSAPATGESSRARSSSRSRTSSISSSATPRPGLSSDDVSRRTWSRSDARRTDLRVPFKYRFSRRVHDAVFATDAPLLPAGRSVLRGGREGAAAGAQGSRTRSSRPRRSRSSAARTAATARCPRSPTSARSRSARRTSATAPVADTRDGLCEVYDTECIWSQAYERLKAYGEEESMLDGPVVVKDNALAGTSAWANTFLGRDHLARRTSESPARDSLRSPRK